MRVDILSPSPVYPKFCPWCGENFVEFRHDEDCAVKFTRIVLYNPLTAYSEIS